MIGKRNGKGKYYEDGKLTYEGEFLNGKKNGKGIEYDKNGNILFEGEYLYGKKMNGNLKEYFKNGNVKFEGEYSNGERNGKGKEYNNNGKLLFEGEYLNGKRWNGKGIEYNDYNKILFEGEYLNGERWNGKGKEYYGSKLIYEKDYLNGEICKEICEIDDLKNKDLTKAIFVNFDSDNYNKLKIPCFPDEEVSELIQRYESLVGTDPYCDFWNKYVFNGKILQYNLTLREEGIVNQDSILVVEERRI